MKAFIPHKDTLLQLARAQREYIDAFNARPATGVFLYPRYPLWAFAEELPEEILGCAIRAPLPCDGGASFPVELESAEGKTMLRIVFATAGDSPSPATGVSCPAAAAPAVRCVQFPLRPRVFRTGTALLQDNGWQLFDERWHKRAELST